MATQYQVEMSSEDGGRETACFDATSLDEAVRMAAEKTRQWIAEGNWGTEGASVSGWWQLNELDTRGDTWIGMDEGGVQVEIEPDHAGLIRRACRDAGPAAEDRCCGDHPEDHDWTSEGEGGCRENPGVWSAGGTALILHDHCRNCGLSRRVRDCGSQRNPGEHDTVEYTMPERWYSSDEE